MKHAIEEDDRGHHTTYNKSSPSSRRLPALHPVLPALLSHLIARRRGAHHHTHNHMQSTDCRRPTKQSLTRQMGRWEIRGCPASPSNDEKTLGAAKQMLRQTNQLGSGRPGAAKPRDIFNFFLKSTPRPELRQFPPHLQSEAVSSVLRGCQGSHISNGR